MIHHELFGQHLRLGNFLFQMAATTALCKKHQCETIYPNWYYLWKYLENPPMTYSEGGYYYTDQLIRPRKWEWTQEEHDWLDTFGQDFREKNMELALNFFFQSYKWFEGYEKEVCESLKPKVEYTDQLTRKYNHLFTDKPTIGIGIRLGDFEGHGDFFQIPYSWYINALDEQFPNWKTDYTIVVFSDDIPKAKRIFQHFPFNYTDFNDTASHRENFKYYHGDASEQFFLGTLMDNFICGNSTFSWWQSYLAKAGTRNGKVVHCGQVFRGKAKQERDITHYYCKDWIQVNI